MAVFRLDWKIKGTILSPRDPDKKKGEGERENKHVEETAASFYPVFEITAGRDWAAEIP